MADAPQPATATRWSARRLGCLGIALPVLAFLFMVGFFMAMPKGRHALTDLEGTIALLVIAAVPVAAAAGIVLCVIAVRRSRREQAGGGVAAIGIVVAILIVALLAFLTYMALQGLAGFR